MRVDSRSKYLRATCFGVFAWLVIPLFACFLTIGALKPYLPVDVSSHEMMVHVEAPSRLLFQIFPTATLLHIVGTLVMFVTYFSFKPSIDAVHVVTRCDPRPNSQT